MAQDWESNTYQPDHVAVTDMQNIETNLLSLKSSFSGTGSPSSPTVGQVWYDTTNKLMKFRESGDSAWYGVMHGDASQKVLVYRNSAMNGWVVDSGVTDKVIALKGGSTYVTGGGTAGTWTVGGLTIEVDDHGTHSHSMQNHTHTVTGESSYNGSWPDSTVGADGATSGPSTANTGTADPGAHNADYSSDASWRPAAAVVTMQYLNI